MQPAQSRPAVDENCSQNNEDDKREVDNEDDVGYVSQNLGHILGALREEIRESA